MRKNRNKKSSLKTKKYKKYKSLKRSFGGILNNIPKVSDDRNVDDIAKVSAALAARRIFLKDPSYGTVLHTASTSVILDTIFKTIANASGKSENSIRKAYSVLNILDIV